MVAVGWPRRGGSPGRASRSRSIGAQRKSDQAAALRAGFKVLVTAEHRSVGATERSGEEGSAGQPTHDRINVSVAPAPTAARVADPSSSYRT
jgi:hypothetical protein